VNKLDAKRTPFGVLKLWNTVSFERILFYHVPPPASSPAKTPVPKGEKISSTLCPWTSPPKPLQSSS
jgi:hypothetical protein